MNVCLSKMRCVGTSLCSCSYSSAQAHPTFSCSAHSLLAAACQAFAASKQRHNVVHLISLCSSCTFRQTIELGDEVLSEMAIGTYTFRLAVTTFLGQSDVATRQFEKQPVGALPTETTVEFDWCFRTMYCFQLPRNKYSSSIGSNRRTSN